ncbi:MAG: GGDEF domain-containing protein [Methylotenera sp.]|nr:GGDEF domain-containing protein [Methylotenera sp.]MDO9232979.1 GGDEF domain-containing protein [Methylotenera sp.]MDO9389584.1 GGDEF domain-containing protein [Methylotenera sp.]MDP2102611.1 GGDEF domain-containing protein [Methylotenera sp.]MDP2280137.1 GGDEF domain-containing protein [Methylotenera sp.]
MKNKLLHHYAELDLDAVFEKFYDTMLSNADFSGFFKDTAQIKSLVVRQKQFLLDSILMTDEEIKTRYVALGEMHHQINVPYVDYMAGMNILEQGLILAVVSHQESMEMLETTFHFFKIIRAYTAKGYLNKMLEADIEDIDRYLTHVQRASEIDTLLATERIIWLKNVVFAIKVGNRAAAPALHMPPDIVDSIKSATSGDNALASYAVDMSARMEMNARNVFYFLDKGSFEEALPLYRELMSIYKLTLMLTNVVTIASTNLLMQNLTKDTLTGLLTRHSFTSILSRELSIATAGQYQLSFIMIDIDFFKNVNDVYGHMAGDLVLAKVAQTAAATMRATDYAFRQGGEEFLLVLKGASLVITCAQAEIMRQKIESLEFEFDGKKFNVTASFGVAVFSAPFDLTYEAMLDVVDKKLYAAKETGRNRVVS